MVSRSYSNLLELASGGSGGDPLPPLGRRRIPRVVTASGIVPDLDVSDDDADAASAASDHSSHAPRERVIIVANQLPVRVSRRPGGGGGGGGGWDFAWDKDSLRAHHGRADMEFVYVGGLRDDVPPAEHDAVAHELLEGFSCVPTFLPADLRSRFYHGFCKQQLWPLFHYMLPLSPELGGRFDRLLWQAYVSVNKIFADKILEVISPDDDFVWVHDYHLMVLPTFLRKRFNRVKLGFFLHSPFPSSEIYKTLPVREELLRSLLNADLIGFHTFDYARHFLSCCSRMLGLKYESQRGYIALEYYGGYDKEEKAARAYDLAVLKYWGSSTTTNFPVADYEKEIEEMKTMTRQEFVASLRRKSSGFSRGASIYRGVTRHHQHGRWQARIGRVAGNKDLYLGTFSTEEEAAEAYDIAAIKFRGLNAVTNFEISRYNVESIMKSNLPVASMSAGGRSNKSLESPPSGSPDAMPVEASTAPLFAALPVKYDQQQQDYLSMLALQHHQQGNLQGLGFGLYSSGVNLDFANSHGTASSMAHCYANGGTSSHEQHQHHQQLQDQHRQCESGTQQSSNSCSSLPFATPIAFNGSYESSMTASGPFGYSYPNVAAFQTPIYGME